MGTKVDIKGVIAGVLLAILSVYYINSTMFSHTHTIDGATISHSHFYGEGHNDDSEGCKHTEGELTLIQHLNNIVLLEIETFDIEEVDVEHIYNVYVPSAISVANKELCTQTSPRAPPCFFV